MKEVPFGGKFFLVTTLPPPVEAEIQKLFHHVNKVAVGVNPQVVDSAALAAAVAAVELLQGLDN